MREKLASPMAFLLLLLVALVCACDTKPKPPEATPEPSNGGASAVPKAKGTPLTLVVAYGSEKKTWFEEQAKKFEAAGSATKSGRPIKIDGRAAGSGESMQAVVDGQLKPHVFSPASGVYVSLLNAAWLSRGGHTKPLAPAGEPLVLSPIVVAMWKPMAEALGWPGKALGWSDLLKVNKDPKGWGSLGHPEWGRFKLAHTHPEYSNSGLLSVLAEAYAGAKKTRGLTAADLRAKGTETFVGQVESSIVYYGKSTGFFADKMLERGPSFLSAAVLYENLVIESYSKQSPFPVVSIYPVEGTFWSDHPYSVLDAEWVGGEEREAAQAFLAFLKQRPQQERALALGFRPADPAIAIGAPVDAAHGADPKQPQTLLEVPDAPTLDALLALWKQTKKASDVIFVMDKSGSMKGKPLEEAKLGAKAFLGMLQDRDEVTLIFFDGQVYPPLGPMKLATGRPELTSRIEMVIADGKTALYDATVEAYELAQNRAKTTPNQIHAVVVMTDGNDEGSKRALTDVTSRFSTEDAPVKVFTIAYGDGADARVLGQIADAAKGSSAKGAPDTIVQVYKDMASFF